MRERGFIALGVQAYVLVAVAVVVLGLVAGLAYYRNSAARYEAEATLARDQRDRAIEAVKAAEEVNEKLRALNVSLSQTIVERDKRAKELEAAKVALRKEINVLKANLDEADKACLDRQLPNSILELLRDRPGNPNPS